MAKTTSLGNVMMACSDFLGCRIMLSSVPDRHRFLRVGCCWHIPLYFRSQWYKGAIEVKHFISQVAVERTLRTPATPSLHTCLSIPGSLDLGELDVRS